MNNVKKSETFKDAQLSLEMLACLRAGNDTGTGGGNGRPDQPGAGTGGGTTPPPPPE